jgi:PAS domain S-box-containing protein
MADHSAATGRYERGSTVPGDPWEATLLEHCPAGLMVVLRDGTIEHVNRAVEVMFGYSRSELIGLSSETLVPAATRRRQRALRRLYFRRPELRNLGRGIELQGLRHDHSEFPLELAFAPLPAAGTLRAVVLLVDVSDRKEQEYDNERRRVELERSNVELEQFTAVASHDMREPLRMIVSYVDLLAEDLAGKLDPRTEKFMGYVSDGAKRMQRLIDDLLAYSRLNARAQPLVPTSAQDALRGVLRDMRPQILESGAEIIYEGLPTLLVDPVQLDQLLQNVVHNAVKFRGDDPPRVQIEAEPAANNFWRFSVRDNGIGIEPKYSQRIFQMFQRLHERGKYEGSGIGLAVAKKIVDRHGGQIWVESNPGQGSTFFFTLPGWVERSA